MMMSDGVYVHTGGPYIIKDEVTPELVAAISSSPKRIAIMQGRRFGKTQILREVLGFREREFTLARFRKGAWR